MLWRLNEPRADLEPFATSTSWPLPSSARLIHGDWTPTPTTTPIAASLARRTSNAFPVERTRPSSMI